MEAQSASKHAPLGKVDSDGGFYVGILEDGCFARILAVHDNLSFNNTPK